MKKVLIVAAYILSKCDDLSAMKLQKLVYYSYSWHLVWEDKKLFDSQIQAWANGPVVPDLYDAHRGMFRVPPGVLNYEGGLAENEIESIDEVINYYGEMSPWHLSELTHREDPWRLARKGKMLGEKSSEPILDSAIAEYYSSLVGPEN